MEGDQEDKISIGNYVIVKRLSYKKIYKVSDSGTLSLGKDEIEMSGIIGHPFWTTFECVGPSSSSNGCSKKKKNPPLTLTVANQVDFFEDLKDIAPSGVDNRSINDDGKSQKLSKEDILLLRETGKSGQEIVSSLIENNSSFSEKTEYSQEKYIRKKEKKYCRFLSIHKPTLPCLHEIYFRNDPSKINSIRMDSLAQILSYCNVKSDGTYILFDSGSSGLGAASMMSRIGADTPGDLVYFHSGNNLPTLTMLRAMNFTQEHMDRLTIASIYDFIKSYYVDDNKIDLQLTQLEAQSENTVDDEVMDIAAEESIKSDEINPNSNESITADLSLKVELKDNTVSHSDLKRKQTQSDNTEDLLPQKKSRRVLEVERACDILKSRKADGLVIIAREHPLNIVKFLLPFLGSSRPFVIFHNLREPLQETYMALRQQNETVNLKLFSNFLRSYQVLPDRTHPSVSTNDLGGYILTGYLVNQIVISKLP